MMMFYLQTYLIEDKTRQAVKKSASIKRKMVKLFSLFIQGYIIYCTCKRTNNYHFKVTLLMYQITFKLM